MQGARSGPASVAILLLAAACGGGGGHGGDAAPAPVARCDWPMWGHAATRTFAYPCPTAISPASASKLKLRWFFKAGDVVTATPAVEVLDEGSSHDVLGTDRVVRSRGRRGG